MPGDRDQSFSEIWTSANHRRALFVAQYAILWLGSCAKNLKTFRSTWIHGSKAGGLAGLKAPSSQPAANSGRAALGASREIRS
jgi:hypothetical protein